MANDTDKAEELLQQSKQTTRHQTNPSDTAEDDVDLTEAVADAYAILEEGDLPENLTLRDRNLAALFVGLQDTGELESVSRRAQEYLGRDEENLDKKATALRLLARVGLEEVAPETLESGKEGYEQYRDNQEIEF